MKKEIRPRYPFALLDVGRRERFWEIHDDIRRSIEALDAWMEDIHEEWFEAEDRWHEEEPGIETPRNDSDPSREDLIDMT